VHGWGARRDYAYGQFLSGVRSRLRRAGEAEAEARLWRCCVQPPGSRRTRWKRDVRVVLPLHAWPRGTRGGASLAAVLTLEARPLHRPRVYRRATRPYGCGGGRPPGFSAKDPLLALGEGCTHYTNAMQHVTMPLSGASPHPDE
jgi:hypothetical protein